MTAIEVLEHLEEVGTVLAEVRRVLAPNGRFYITVPNRLFPFETHTVTIGHRHITGRRVPLLPWIPSLHDRWTDVGSFTVRTLRALLCGAGFSMSKPEYVMPPFDRWRTGGRFIRPLTDVLDHTPIRRFGVSLVVCACKRSGPYAANGRG